MGIENMDLCEETPAEEMVLGPKNGFVMVAKKSTGQEFLET